MSETRNYRIELMVNCDLATLKAATDAAFDACEAVVDCAEQVIDDETGKVVDI